MKLKTASYTLMTTCTILSVVLIFVPLPLFFHLKKKYKETRNVLPYGIFNIVNLNIVNTHVILWGDSAISVIENKHLFYRYNIEDTTRFS